MLAILIADDHEMIRKGLKEILLNRFPWAYIEEAGDGEVLVTKALERDWNIIISDISMPFMSGIDALCFIKKCSPAVRMLLISIQTEREYSSKLLKLGAAGYISKTAALSEIVAAVQQILQTGWYLSPSVV